MAPVGQASATSFGLAGAWNTLQGHWAFDRGFLFGNHGGDVGQELFTVEDDSIFDGVFDSVVLEIPVICLCPLRCWLWKMEWRGVF